MFNATLAKTTNPLARLLWVIFFNQTCLTMTFPLLTLLFFDTQSRLFPADTPFAERSLWYGLCVAVPSFLNLFFTPLLSSLSDIYGRKKMLLIEIFSAAFFTLTAAFGVIYGIFACLFCGFIIQGTLTRTNPTAIAYVNDISPPAKKLRYMGYLQFAISVGAFSGPLIGGYFAKRFFFAELNFSVPYLIAALFAIVAGVLGKLFLQATQTRVASVTVRNHLINWSTWRTLLLQPVILRVSVILLLSQISWSLYYQFIPPTLKTLYQFDAQTLGIFIGCIAFWLALATGVGIKLLERYFTMQTILCLSLYAIFIGLLLSILASYFAWPYVLWLAAMPIAAGDVIAYTCLTTLFSNAAGPQSQGKVLGFSFIIIGGVWASTGLLGGVLLAYSPLLPLLVAPIGVIGAIGLVHCHGRKAVTMAC